MSNKRTYKDYKDFFDEVNYHKKEKNYLYSYVLLFSFLEDRINRIFNVGYFLTNRMKPRSDYTRNLTLCGKCKVIREEYQVRLYKTDQQRIWSLTKRRHELVHKALFNHHKVLLSDVTELEEMCRTINKIRENQKRIIKKKPPTRSKEFNRIVAQMIKPKKISLTNSNFRHIPNPTEYPATHNPYKKGG